MSIYIGFLGLGSSALICTFAYLFYFLLRAMPTKFSTPHPFKVVKNKEYECLTKTVNKKICNTPEPTQTGVPEPMVQWRREGGKDIVLRAESRDKQGE